MADVISGKDMTVIVLDNEETVELTNLIVNFMDHYVGEGEWENAPDSVGILYNLYDCLR